MKQQYPKMPPWNKRTAPFFHASIDLYHDMVDQINAKIAAATTRLAEPLDEKTRDTWQDRLEEYHRQTERLEQMKASGWFVSAAKCKGQKGMFDWEGFNKFRVGEMQRDIEVLQKMLLTTVDEEQRSLINQSIERVQFRIDDLTTKTLTVAQKQSLIARLVKEKINE